MIQQREQERKQENLRRESYITEEKKEEKDENKVKKFRRNILGERTGVNLQLKANEPVQTREGKHLSEIGDVNNHYNGTT